MQMVTQTERQRKRMLGDLEALGRGSNRQPNANDMQTILEFSGRGIPTNDIETCGPDQNVRTYRAWRALGRQVRKGEKSVRLTVWMPQGDELGPDGERIENRRMRPVSACVFHVSQTDATGNGKAATA